jgi:hypothetical protein
MKHLLIVSLASLAALAAPASSQKTGSTNMRAPVITQSLELPAANNAKISLTYTSITWAGGEFMKNLEDSRGRERLNKLASERPLGELTTSIPLTLAGKTVPAGTHKLSFQIDPVVPVTNDPSGSPSNTGWRLVLSPQGGQPIECPLELKPSPTQQTRLIVAVVPGAKDTEADLHVAFGSMSCNLPVQPSGNAAKDAAGEKPMKGDGMGKEGKEMKKEK